MVTVEPQTHRERCLWLAAIFEKPRHEIDVRGRKYILPIIETDLFIARALRAYADHEIGQLRKTE